VTFREESAGSLKKTKIKHMIIRQKKGASAQVMRDHYEPASTDAAASSGGAPPLTLSQRLKITTKNKYDYSKLFRSGARFQGSPPPAWK